MLTILPDAPHNGYIVRVYEHIDKGNWAYSIYKVTSAEGMEKQSWKNIRAIEHYIKPEAAEQAAKNYIDNHLNPK